MAGLMNQKQMPHTVGSKDIFTTVGTISNLLVNLIKGGSVHFSFWGHAIAENKMEKCLLKSYYIRPFWYVTRDFTEDMATTSV